MEFILQSNTTDYKADYGHYLSPPYLLFPTGVLHSCGLHTPNFSHHDTFQGPEFMFSTAWVYINIFQDVMAHRFMSGEVHCGEMWVLFTIVPGMLEAESHGKGAAVTKVIYSDEERSLG